MNSLAQRAGVIALAMRRHRSMHRPIAGAIVLIGALTFASKLAVVAKEALIAGRFGAGDAVDAFFVALLLPSFALNVIAGSIHSSFLPAYVQIREQDGQAAADHLTAAVLARTLAMLGALAITFALFARPLLALAGSEFSSDKLLLTVRLFYVLLPTLLVSGVMTVWSTTLNAGQRFGVVAAAPIITPAAVALALLTIGDGWGIYAVAVGTAIGVTLEASVIGYWTHRRGLTLRPRWRGDTAALRRVGRQLAPMLAGALLMSSSTLIDQGMAARLESGSVSALNFGSRLVTGILGIAGVALGTAVFPRFASLLAARNKREAVSILRIYCRTVVAASVPLVLVIVLFSHNIVRILFERGNFTAQNTDVVSGIQSLYALQIPFFLIGLLGVRFISSLRGNYLLLWIGAANVVTNIIGNLIFMRLLGVAGIALSTAIVYALSALMIFLAIRYLIRKEFNT